MAQIKIKYSNIHNVIWSLLKLVRSNNLLMLVACLYLTRLFIIGPRSDWYSLLFEPEIFLLSLAAVCITSAGYIINDYYDVKIDWHNKPARVIIDTKIHRRYALLLHALLNLVALGIGLYFSVNVLLYFTFCIFLLWWYSNLLKRKALIGNLSIATLVGMTLLLPALYYRQLPVLLVLFGVFGFLTTLNREIAKDIEDMKGDQLFGCRTFPIVYGIRKTKYLLTFLGSLTIALLSISLVWVELKVYVFWMLFCVLPMIWVLYSTYYASNPQHFKKISFTWKLIMVAGLFGAIV